MSRAPRPAAINFIAPPPRIGKVGPLAVPPGAGDLRMQVAADAAGHAVHVGVLTQNPVDAEGEQHMVAIEHPRRVGRTLGSTSWVPSCGHLLLPRRREVLGATSASAAIVQLGSVPTKSRRDCRRL